MPIGSIRNGNHPSALVMAGNHADDYEGRVTLSRLARSLEAGDISGHPVLLPKVHRLVDLYSSGLSLIYLPST